ncbi:MAG: hypothetical protein HY235_30415 [Acidobacteria bacterium]|nr:hypothetical protein [Acidobacteriota bacterium]
MFTPAPESGTFRQGEILSDVVQVHIGLDSVNPEAGEIAVEERLHPQAIILTQDCDLDWDFKAREEGEEGNRLQLKLVPNILLCELIPADTLRGQMRDAGVRGSDLWKRIEQNRDERYHWFSQVSSEADRLAEGLPALVVDFKRVFTVPTDELYARLQYGVRRRSVLQTPFLQHFSARFGYYCLRVALPEVPPPALPPA